MFTTSTSQVPGSPRHHHHHHTRCKCVHAQRNPRRVLYSKKFGREPSPVVPLLIITYSFSIRPKSSHPLLSSLSNLWFSSSQPGPHFWAPARTASKDRWNPSRTFFFRLGPPHLVLPPPPPPRRKPFPTLPRRMRMRPQLHTFVICIAPPLTHEAFSVALLSTLDGSSTTAFSRR